jgi:hypothetical protein
MSQKYEWPYYGIEIPPGLIKSDTKTYDIYKEHCGDLENCITNSHYTIPKTRCSPREGIILPHYTTYNKQTRTSDRTYFFPENIDNPKICDNMINYTSKIERPDKICHTQNNSCRITISRDDIPDVFTQIFEIINELEIVFNFLKTFCETSDKQKNQNLERRIDNIISSYDSIRQNMLYNASDTYLNAPMDSTRTYLTTLHTSLIIDRAEYSNKNEYMEYIKQVLIDKYIFLSHFIQYIIGQPVDIRKEVTKIQALEHCLPDIEDVSFESSKGMFSALAISDSDEGSPQADREQGISSEARVSDTPLLGEKKVLDVHLSEQSLLDQSIKEIRSRLRERIKGILEFHITEDFVLEYIKNPIIDIEIIYNIRNECDDLLLSIQDYISKMGEKDKPIISEENKMNIQNKRDLANILLIYYAYPNYQSIIGQILDLNENQTIFLNKYYYRFDKRFYINFVRATDDKQNYVRLFDKIRHSNFLNIVCFLLITSIIIPNTDIIIKNIINNLHPFTGITKTKDIIEVFKNYIVINVELNQFNLNVALIEMLLTIYDYIIKIDKQLCDVKNNPYQILGLPDYTDFLQVNVTILRHYQQGTTTPAIMEAKNLVGTVKKKTDFDNRLKQNEEIYIIFTRCLKRIIIKMLDNLLQSQKLYYEMFQYAVDNIISIIEKYNNDLGCPIFKNRITFFLTIITNLKLIHNDHVELTNSEIYKTIIDHINQPYPFSNEIEKEVLLYTLYCNALITKDKLDNTNKTEPEWQQLYEQFATDISAIDSIF